MWKNGKICFVYRFCEKSFQSCFHQSPGFVKHWKQWKGKNSRLTWFVKSLLILLGTEPRYSTEIQAESHLQNTDWKWENKMFQNVVLRQICSFPTLHNVVSSEVVLLTLLGKAWKQHVWIHKAIGCAGYKKREKKKDEI